jgi:hypothetical protein
MDPLVRALFVNRNVHNQWEVHLDDVGDPIEGSAGSNRWWVYLDRRQGDSMRTMGLLATVALAVLGAAAATLTLAAIPDINRYLRIRRM